MQHRMSTLSAGSEPVSERRGLSGHHTAVRRTTVLLALAAALALSLSACDWATSRFSQQSSGWNQSETSITPANVHTVAQAFQANPGAGIESSVVTDNGTAFVSATRVNGATGDSGTLYAYSANGTTNCSGAPRICRPLWTATVSGALITATPAVGDNIVYVGAWDGNVYAYDATGTTNCSGTPKVCAPLWTAHTGGSIYGSAMPLAGFLYVGSTDGKLYAFGSNGVTNCSGTPTVCQPLWTSYTANPGAITFSPSIGGDVAWVTSGYGLLAYDATGTVGCSGTPKVCTSLGGYVGQTSLMSSPTIANGIVYFSDINGVIHALKRP